MKVIRPVCLDCLTKARAAHPDAVLVGGATWLQLDWREAGAKPEAIVSLARVAEMQGIEPLGEGLRIGAAVTLSALLAEPLVAERAPLLRAAAAAIAAPTIRGLATLGGNVMRGNGDAIPALIASGARLIYADRAEPCHGAPAPGVLVAVEIPAPPLAFAFEKVIPRAAFAVSAVAVALARHAGETRIAAGGGAVPPQRLTAAESASDPAAAVRATLRLPEGLPDAAWRRAAAANLVAGHLARIAA
jgi:carbon-monoxide dehydrogenase medium subunit